LPVVPGAAVIFLTDVVQEIDAGNHTLFIGEVTHLERQPEAEPLLFCGGKFARLAGIALGPPIPAFG
jgi:flavin reductase (DIM6/NTAB) family NADH-FMN oxidoreductase RutF